MPERLACSPAWLLGAARHRGVRRDADGLTYGPDGGPKVDGGARGPPAGRNTGGCSCCRHVASRAHAGARRVVGVIERDRQRTNLA